LLSSFAELKQHVKPCCVVLCRTEKQTCARGKKNKHWTEFDGGGEYLVFCISLSLHREGRERKDGSLSHAAKSELTLPLTCFQRTA
jgi:hypothetical protein